MKRIITLTLVALVACHMHAQNLVPNGSFETWDYYNTWTLEPQYWYTPNDQLTETVVQDSNAFEGNLAMRVKVLSGFEGGVAQTADVIVPLSSFPSVLHFAVKASVPDGDENDQVSVTVNFFNEDALVLSHTWTATDSIAQWEEVNFGFVPPGATVTEAQIIVSAGYNGPLGGGSWDTWISVDDMYWTTAESVEDTHVAALELFPNPANDALNLKCLNVVGKGCCFSITDISGKVVYTNTNNAAMYNNGTLQIDVSALPGGSYIAMYNSGSSILRKHFVVAH
jgi:hypothetical protein